MLREINRDVDNSKSAAGIIQAKAPAPPMMPNTQVGNVSFTKFKNAISGVFNGLLAYTNTAVKPMIIGKIKSKWQIGNHTAL